MREGDTRKRREKREEIERERKKKRERRKRRERRQRRDRNERREKRGKGGRERMERSEREREREKKKQIIRQRKGCKKHENLVKNHWFYGCSRPPNTRDSLNPHGRASSTLHRATLRPKVFQGLRGVPEAPNPGEHHGPQPQGCQKRSKC